MAYSFNPFTGTFDDVGSGLDSVVAGDNIIIDDTDPKNPIISSTGGSGGVIHYLQQGEPSDITDYDIACGTCALPTETTVSKSLVAGDNHYGDFITRVGSPGIRTIAEGFWNAHIYYQVSSTSGTNSVRVEVYKRDTDNNETHLFDINSISDLDSTVPTDIYLYHLNNEIISLDPTDRIVYKVYVIRDGGGTRTFTMYFNGETRPTHIHTPILRAGDGGGGDTGFRLQDQELTSTYAYAGYEHETNENWYIYRRTRSNNMREYATGSSDYSTAWTDRASQVYS